MIEQVEITATQQYQRPSFNGKAKIAGGVLILLILLAIGIVPRVVGAREAIAAMNASPITHPVVSIVHAEEGKPTTEVLLPGNIEPLYSAAIYARTEGYLQHRSVDIGSKVKAGQLLAVISSPEVDQQLLQARATLAQSEAALEQAQATLQQAKANEELARLTRDRDLPLGQQHASSGLQRAGCRCSRG